MGKPFWMKHLGEESGDKQPGCMWGLVHVLDYHHWQSNARKMIQHRKFEGRNHDRGGWSPESSIYHHDADEAETLLGEKQNLHLSSKRCRATKKRSLRARIRAMIAEDISKENKKRAEKGRFSVKPNLQRTYSIHHLESIDDNGLGKICTDWKQPIIFFPKNVENGSTQPSDATEMEVAGDLEDLEDASRLDRREDPDVFEIFKVDKELLLKHLKKKAKFSKSRSFPVADMAEGRKLKPIKLEDKQKEVWSFPRDDKSQTSNEAPGREVNTATDRIGENLTHKRSSSLNESLDKYARLFENSFGKDGKLNSSKSLRLTNEYGLAPMYFRRIHSLSYVDSCYSNLNFETLVDTSSGIGSAVTAKHSSSCLQNTEAENVVSQYVSDEENEFFNAEMQINEECESVDGFKEETDKIKKKDSLCEDINSSDIDHNELQDQSFDLDSYMYLQEIEPQIPKGLEHESGVEEMSSSMDTKFSRIVNDEISDKTINLKHDVCSKKKNSDIDYVRHLLEQSDIAMDATEMTWHSSNQPFSPQLFEDTEDHWPYERDELNVNPDFNSCWHHQMLFDLVNEVLVEVYDISLPYYPKALSSGCHVRPFPVGGHIIEEVCTSIGTLMEENESIDCIVARDLAHDHSWMNLQLDTESISLDLEDMIFDEVLQEIIGLGSSH